MPALTTVAQSLQPDKLRSIIDHGLGESANPTKPYMPVWGEVISQTQVTDLIAYLRAGLPTVATAEPPAPSVFYDLPDILVNLNTSGKRTSFLKLKVSLELAKQSDVPILESVLPRVVDNFQVYLRELRAEDLRGSAGLYRLREELLMRVRAAAKPADVKDVLFKEMLIQ